MKNGLFSMALVALVVAVLSGCAAMPQTWPDKERNAESKMVVIQEKIGDGLKTAALTPDQSQMFLATLKDIRTDYTALTSKPARRDEWNSLNVRLERLGNDIDGALVQPLGIEGPRTGDRIVALQWSIDDGRVSERLPAGEGREIQYRLDSVRRDYLHLTEGGRSMSYQEEADISRRLDALEIELNQYR